MVCNSRVTERCRANDADHAQHDRCASDERTAPSSNRQVLIPAPNSSKLITSSLFFSKCYVHPEPVVQCVCVHACRDTFREPSLGCDLYPKITVLGTRAGGGALGGGALEAPVRLTFLVLGLSAVGTRGCSRRPTRHVVCAINNGKSWQTMRTSWPNSLPYSPNDPGWDGTTCA